MVLASLSPQHPPIQEHCDEDSTSTATSSNMGMHQQRVSHPGTCLIVAEKIASIKKINISQVLKGSETAIKLLYNFF